MGLNNRVFDLMARFCRKAPASPMPKALAAGYPDCIVYPDMLEQHFGRADFPRDRASDKIKVMHGQPKLDYARDPFPVFAALGYELTVIDLIQERGCEIEVDLNEPFALGAYELVLDHGTIEHCFNVAQAAKNLAAAVAKDGFIVQHLPANMPNHGFYNFSPTWFLDFYQENGFAILHFEGWDMDKRDTFELPGYNMDFHSMPPASLITMVAKRIQTGAIKFPVQAVYRQAAQLQAQRNAGR